MEIISFLNWIKLKNLNKIEVKTFVLLNIMF